MADSIPRHQNSDEIVNLIAASKYVFSRTKKLLGVYFLFSVVFVVLFSILNVLFNSSTFANYFNIERKDISAWFSSFSLVVLAFSKIFLVSYIDKNKLLAAKLQETADRKLFGLPWDSSILGEPICQSLVYRYSQKLFKKNERGLVENWYPTGIERLPISYQALVCQYSCLSWDLSLRKRYNCLLFLLGIAIFIIVLIMSFLGDMRVSSIFINIIAVIAPLTSFGFDVYKGNNDSIDNANVLKSSWDEFFSQGIKKLDERSANIKIEKIQAQLYSKRKTDFPIPDSVYKYFRSGQQEEMFHTADSLAAELSKHID